VSLRCLATDSVAWQTQLAIPGCGLDAPWYALVFTLPEMAGWTGAAQPGRRR
jgi:hypothetical protein